MFVCFVSCAENVSCTCRSFVFTRNLLDTFSISLIVDIHLLFAIPSILVNVIRGYCFTLALSVIVDTCFCTCSGVSLISLIQSCLDFLRSFDHFIIVVSFAFRLYWFVVKVG